MTDLASILSQICVDFVTDLASFCDRFASILSQICVDFVTDLSRFCHRFGVDFVTICRLFADNMTMDDVLCDMTRYDHGRRPV